MKQKDLKVPKYSHRGGFTDEGISDNLGKPKSFRYSDEFLKKWYAMPLVPKRLKRFLSFKT